MMVRVASDFVCVRVRARARVCACVCNFQAFNNSACCAGIDAAVGPYGVGQYFNCLCNEDVLEEVWLVGTMAIRSDFEHLLQHCVAEWNSSTVWAGMSGDGCFGKYTSGMGMHDDVAYTVRVQDGTAAYPKLTGFAGPSSSKSPGLAAPQIGSYAESCELLAADLYYQCNAVPGRCGAALAPTL